MSVLLDMNKLLTLGVIRRRDQDVCEDTDEIMKHVNL